MFGFEFGHEFGYVPTEASDGGDGDHDGAPLRLSIRIGL